MDFDDMIPMHPVGGSGEDIMHHLGDSIMEFSDYERRNPFSVEGMANRVGEAALGWAADHPKTTAALAGAGALTGAIALAPEMTAGGVLAGGLAGLEAMGVDTGLATAVGLAFA